MTPNQCCMAGEESPSLPVSQVSHPGLRMYEYAGCRCEWWCPWCQCPVACPGCHSSVSAGVGCTGHSRPADRAQKVHKQDAILISKDSGDNFPRRRSSPELPSSKRLRMFILQWLPLRLGSIVANPRLVAGHHPAKELRVKLRRTKCEILERNVASSLSSYRRCSDAKLSS